jgi:hypothetical protein
MLVVKFIPRPPYLWDRTPVHVAQDAGCAAEPVWMQPTTGNFTVAAGSR